MKFPCELHEGFWVHQRPTISTHNQHINVRVHLAFFWAFSCIRRFISEVRLCSVVMERWMLLLTSSTARMHVRLTLCCTQRLTHTVVFVCVHVCQHTAIFLHSPLSTYSHVSNVFENTIYHLDGRIGKQPQHSGGGSLKGEACLCFFEKSNMRWIIHNRQPNNWSVRCTASRFGLIDCWQWMNPLLWFTVLLRRSHACVCLYPHMQMLHKSKVSGYYTHTLHH